MNTPKHGGSYGCVQEVLHPNSKDAEPLAQLLYDSDNDPEANDVESAALPRKTPDPKAID